MRQYKLTEGGLQYQFQQSRAKIQIFGGGFANGKTTAGTIKGLQLARDYPGSNGLIARATFPKLNDTIRKEFYKWCPSSWIKRAVMSQENICELNNGSVINFRYVQQGGKNEESSSSNLLSASYDWIIVDQLEDPEISEKDFLDLLGRLRGNAKYEGTDPSMPSTGPRWFIGLCNPTRNWVFRKLIKPLHDHKQGLQNPDLFVDKNGNPVIELFEGSTYTNKDNLEADYIELLESTYTGQMRERYLLGKWQAFEGLIYPQYDANTHMVDHSILFDHFRRQLEMGLQAEIIEAYDHGIASPSCYGWGFSDAYGNAYILDGFYEKEQSISQITERIKEHRRVIEREMGFDFSFKPILADPSIFRRTSGTGKTVGITVAGMLQESGIRCRRANNDIIGGIAKVGSYLEMDRMHLNPITGEIGAPRVYFSTNCHWIDREIVDYYWKKDTAGNYEDVPRDINDHAMDMTKYFFTDRPRVSLYKRRNTELPKRYLRWSELEARSRDSRSHRYAHG